MSNSYAVSELLPDPSGTVAGKTMDFRTPKRLANSINYAFATGATYNVVSQSYADRTFIQGSSSLTEMSEWRIPLVSLEHNELEVVVHYDILGSSSNCNLRFVLEVDTVTSTLLLNCPSTASIASNSFTISMPSSNQYYATLTVQAQGDSSVNADLHVKSIMARWKPLSSPLSAGFKNQYETSEQFTPFGVSRTGDEQAFTSRFAHNMIDNVPMLRKRLRNYISWSGCYSSDSNTLGNYADAAAPEINIGVGSIGVLRGYPLAPGGYDSLSHRKLELHVRSIGVSSSTPRQEFDFFGNRISFPSSPGTVSWSIHEIDMNYERISNLGDTLLPYYNASFDDSSVNHSTLTDYDSVTQFKYPNVNVSNYGTILGLSLMGI